jgi:nitroreductase
MAMERSFGEIRLADFDILELSNLNRIRTGVHNLGVSKAVATAREIAEIDPYLRVVCFCEGITEANIDRFLLEGGRLNLLIDECDGLDIKLLARHRARALRIPVVMDTSDRGLVDVERFDLEPTRPIFHGLVGDIDYRALKGLSNEEKVPYVVKIIGIDTASERLKASLIEFEQTVSTWPQLASAVTLGGAIGADVYRRIMLDQYHDSGRYYVDVETIVGDTIVHQCADALPTPPGDNHLTHEDMRYLIDQVEHRPQPGQILPSEEQIHLLVEAGIMAPSGGNMQPWMWVCASGVLYLFHDKARSVSFLDYDDHASLIALGAAAENVILRAFMLGLEVEFRAFPLRDQRRLVATFRFFETLTGQRRETHVCDSLASAISFRNTNRRIGERIQIDPEQLRVITGAAETIAGANMCVLESAEDLQRIGAILGAADRIRMMHKMAHREMMNEFRWTAEEAFATRDGIDIATMELSPTDTAGTFICRDWAAIDLVRQWKLGRGFEKLTRKAIKAASAVALLTMPQSRDEDYVQGGRAMQRAWLAATQAGIAVQPMHIWFSLRRHLIAGGAELMPETIAELNSLQEIYTRLFPFNADTGEIALFRLAIVDEPQSRALRRPVTDVLHFYSSR